MHGVGASNDGSSRKKLPTTVLIPFNMVRASPSSPKCATSFSTRLLTARAGSPASSASARLAATGDWRAGSTAALCHDAKSDGATLPAGSASVESLPATPLYILKQRAADASKFWYAFARNRPLIDVRSGIPVHIYGSNAMTAVEDGVHVRRLIRELAQPLTSSLHHEGNRTSLHTILVEQPPELWNTSDPSLYRIMNKYIACLEPAAAAAAKSYGIPLTPAVIKQLGVEEAENQAWIQESARRESFHAALNESRSKVVDEDFVESCRWLGNIQHWECMEAFRKGNALKIPLKAIDMPLERGLELDQMLQLAWKAYLNDSSREAKLVPLAERLARAGNLEPGDILGLWPQREVEGPLFDSGKPATTPGEIIKERGLSLLDKAWRLFNADKFVSVIHPARLYGFAGLQTVKALNECLFDTKNGVPDLLPLKSRRQEYLAHAIWRISGAAVSSHKVPISASDNRSSDQDPLASEPSSPSASLAERLDSPVSGYWRQFWQWAAAETKPTAHDYIAPGILPHIDAASFIPPSRLAPLAKQCRILALVQREHVPGIIQYWKRLNAHVPHDQRWDRHALSSGGM